MSVLNVLIVDDNDLIRSALHLLLKNQQNIHVIGECKDGDEVLDFIRSKRDIHVIIMDVSMPRMDGIMASKLVKEEFPQIEIIILSMHDHETYKEAMNEIGVYKFVKKESHTSILTTLLSELQLFNENK